jgi:hypothetical protein
MLDTRYIEGFVKPQTTIDLLNNFSRHQFSPWSKDSTNLVITDLLKDHIVTCLRNDNNVRKLYDTMMKVGVKKHEQMLIMTTSGTFGLFEPDGERSYKLGIGIIGKKTEIYVTMRAEYIGDENGEFDEKCVCHFIDICAAKGIKPKEPNMTVRQVIDNLSAIYASWFLFLQFVETETIYVEPKQKFHAKKYEGFKNQQGLRIQVADIGWSREIVAKVPVGVAGHFRNQACGPGHLDRKLIYIDPFQRNYHRKSGKDRILKH